MMKKLNILTIMCVVLGLSGSAFALDCSIRESNARYFMERAQKQAQVNLLLEKGKKGALSYTITTQEKKPFARFSNASEQPPQTLSFSKNGKIYGREIIAGSKHIIIMFKSDWEQIYHEVMPAWTERQGKRVIQQQTLSINGATYVFSGKELLPHTHYYHAGQKQFYTIITFTMKK